LFTAHAKKIGKTDPAFPQVQGNKCRSVSLFTNERWNIEIVHACIHHWPRQIVSWTIYKSWRGSWHCCSYCRRCNRHWLLIETSCDHGYLHFVFHIFIDDGAKNNVGVIICGFADD